MPLYGLVPIITLMLLFFVAAVVVREFVYLHVWQQPFRLSAVDDAVVADSQFVENGLGYAGVEFGYQRMRLIRERVCRTVETDDAALLE